MIVASHSQTSSYHSVTFLPEVMISKLMLQGKEMGYPFLLSYKQTDRQTDR